VNRVAIKPEILRWARERAGRSTESLTAKFPKLEQWERGEVKPTLKQLAWR
jgi:ribosome-binding protein aMBF1 (putative translation factor)